MSPLQGLCTAHNGVSLVYWDFTNTLESRTGQRRLTDGEVIQTVIQMRSDVSVGREDFGPYLFWGLIIETTELQQISQHPKNLPGRTCLAQWCNNPIEALHTSLGIDECA